MRSDRRLWSFKQLMAVVEADIPWLVEPLIVRGDKVLLYGDFGALKTWILMSLALTLAAGRSWLGVFKLSRPYRVLYIDEEMSVRRFRKRLRQLARGMDITLTEDLPIRLLSRSGFKLDSPEKTRMLLGAIMKQFDPDIVIVETVRRVLTGSEKETADITKFWEAVDPLIEDEDRGRTVILSHHMRKPRSKSENARHRQSGSTDLQAGADSTFALERSRNGAVIEQIKNREDEEYPPFEVALEGSGSEPIVLRYLGASTESASLFDRLKATVPDVIARQPKETVMVGVLGKLLREQRHKFSQKTLGRVLDALVADKVIKPTRRRGEYRLMGHETGHPKEMSPVPSDGTGTAGGDTRRDTEGMSCPMSQVDDIPADLLAEPVDMEAVEAVLQRMDAEEK